MGKCSQCGADVKADWRACPKCGAQFMLEPAALQPKRHSLLAWGAMAIVLVIMVGVVLAALGVGGGSKDTAAAAPTASPAPATVQVEGTLNLEFSGSILDGAGSHSVQGKIPASFTMSRGAVYSIFFQKKGRPGTMTITVNCNGHSNSNATNAEFGVVTVVCR